MRLGLVLILVVLSYSTQASAFRRHGGGGGGSLPTIWLTPQDNQPRTGWAGSTDFMSLFPSGAPWITAQRWVKVFKIYPQFVLGASDADLTALIVGLQARNIPLAVEFGLLTGPHCGTVEGYCGEQTGAMVSRVQSHGGTLKYVAMDEPLWFGHVQVGTSIAALATDVANQVATIHATFPSCQVGDIEPLPGASAPGDWATQIDTWQAAYQTATGLSLAFFHTEMIWPDATSRAQMAAVSASTRARGIRYGLLYDGDSTSTTGLQWTLGAEQFFSFIEQTFVPDDAVLQTFAAQPALSLPETTAGTMTSLVVRYITTETILAATRGGSNFTGTLTVLGQPIVGATVTATRLDTNAVYDTQVTNSSGAFTAALVGVPVRFDYAGNASYRLSFVFVM